MRKKRRKKWRRVKRRVKKLMVRRVVVRVRRRVVRRLREVFRFFSSRTKTNKALKFVLFLMMRGNRYILYIVLFLV